MWLETPLVDHDYHCAALFGFYLLFVPLWETLGYDNKKCVMEWFGIHGKKATDPSVISEQHTFYSTRKPQSGSHTSLSGGSQTLGDERLAE